MFPQSVLFYILDNPKHTENNQSKDTIITFTQLQFPKCVMLGKLDEEQGTQS